MGYYYSIVRNINDNVDRNILENMRKYMCKSKANVRYFMVKEISPENKQLHIHVCAYVETLDDKFTLEKYFDTHRLKAYVDKYKPMTKADVCPYIIYMMKDLPKDRLAVQKQDFDLYEKDMAHTFQHQCKPLKKFMDDFQVPIKFSDDEDPFIDD